MFSSKSIKPHAHNMSLSQLPKTLYVGIRGKKFTYFIQQILSLSNLNPQYFDVLLDKESIKIYEQAFTHKTADEIENYEYLEFLGDTTLNKSIAWYLSRRFPQLNCPKGVKILTRLKINLISKKSFASFAKQLRFWDFVSATDDIRSTKMDKTLEDVFEAFFGATEMLIDTRIQFGAGYAICYGIIAHLLDSKPLPLKYEDLFDAKTRLKEVFDHFGEKIGRLEYTSKKEDRIHHVQIVAQNKILGEGSAPLKIDAEQKAADKAIRMLKNMGFSKPISEECQMFLDPQT